MTAVDLSSGDAVHWLRISGFGKELSEGARVPGLRRPMALDCRSEKMRRHIVVGAPPRPA